MTHLDIITEAYDRCGIIYALVCEDDCTFLYLAGSEERKAEIERTSRQRIGERFIEFENGQLASY